MSLNSKMGQAHELFLVKMLGGRKTKASGSQWTDQMDGRHNRMRELFAFAWDGKSTLGKSISVTRKMWDKAREQALGERPMLALRFYDTEKLDVWKDLVVLALDDFAEILEVVNKPLLEPTRIFIPFPMERSVKEPSGYCIWVRLPDGEMYKARTVRVDRRDADEFRPEFGRPTVTVVSVPRPKIEIDDREILPPVDFHWGDGFRMVIQ